jgi:acetyl esterase
MKDAMMELTTPPQPNRQAARYLEPLKPEHLWVSDTLVANIGQFREGFGEFMHRERVQLPVESVTDVDANGVPSRLYRPSGDEGGVLVWLHGGAFLIGDLESTDALARALASLAGCAVLSVGYRLAPEHRYPAAIDDAWAATQWAAAEFGSVVVGGDSAGGNLAAAVALRARDHRLALDGQLLVYPVLAYAPDSPHLDEYRIRYADFSGKEGYTDGVRDSQESIWRAYVPDIDRRKEQDASPGLAASVEGLAPTVVITAEHDALTPGCADYVDRLRAAGVPVEHTDYKGQIHGFFHQLATMPDSWHAIGTATTGLRALLSRGIS